MNVKVFWDTRPKLFFINLLKQLEDFSSSFFIRNLQNDCYLIF
jgi:hypothetical protein